MGRALLSCTEASFLQQPTVCLARTFGSAAEAFITTSPNREQLADKAAGCKVARGVGGPSPLAENEASTDLPADEAVGRTVAASSADSRACQG